MSSYAVLISFIQKFKRNCLSIFKHLKQCVFIVRDSAARLPNGEGTRADICELLKDSQYLALASDQQVMC